MSEYYNKKTWCTPCKEDDPKNCRFGEVPCKEWHERQKNEKLSYESGFSSSGTSFKSSSMPYDLFFRCMSCGHWFKSDTKLANHAQWCCAASADGVLSWAIPCECCDTIDEVTKLRDGWEIPSEEKEEPVGAEAV